MELHVALGKDSYPIQIQNTLLSKVTPYIEEIFSGKRIFLISDDNVFPLYGPALLASLEERYRCHHLVLKSGEPTKSFESLPGIYAQLAKAKMTRSDLIIALGGGVIGDLVGFVASSYLRGVPFVQIPTSLLAQVDSSVGGKVAIDIPEGKNLVGAFYQPKLVLIDPDTLLTLPEKYLGDGMGEVIKYGLIREPQLFETLRNHQGFHDLKGLQTEIIGNCVDCKRKIVEKDPFDKGERMLLNFGHTLAHAIEQYYDYKRESHGEAVAIGMYQITRLAEEKGLSPKGSAAAIKEVLLRYGLPYECGLPLEELIATIGLDKKNLNNALNLILLKDIGEAYIYPTDVNFFISDTIKTI